MRNPETLEIAFRLQLHVLAEIGNKQACGRLPGGVSTVSGFSCSAISWVIFSNSANIVCRKSVAITSSTCLFTR